ncbi:hypothetical protein E2I00_013356 [Balaenoptera physalus]|uniref:Uncharacterized protein n=1 Tax=Balaenoptera physalus TaxID=9770 RepID=A0A643BS33_BALPH|nr:hypothetical protein E2I00_013356 [Balaenoptera physalus]
MKEADGSHGGKQDHKGGPRIISLRAMAGVLEAVVFPSTLLFSASSERRTIEIRRHTIPKIGGPRRIGQHSTMVTNPTALENLWDPTRVTVIDLPNAQEKPMEMKAPTTTAHPQPPSGGVYPTGPPFDGGIASVGFGVSSRKTAAYTEVGKEERLPKPEDRAQQELRLDPGDPRMPGSYKPLITEAAQPMGPAPGRHSQVRHPLFKRHKVNTVLEVGEHMAGLKGDSPPPLDAKRIRREMMQDSLEFGQLADIYIYGVLARNPPSPGPKLPSFETTCDQPSPPLSIGCSGKPSRPLGFRRRLRPMGLRSQKRPRTQGLRSVAAGRQVLPSEEDRVKKEMRNQLVVKLNRKESDTSPKIMLRVEYERAWRDKRRNRWCRHKKPKKSTWKFNLDLTHPVEDRSLILEILNSFHERRLKSMEKLEILGMRTIFMIDFMWLHLTRRLMKFVTSRLVKMKMDLSLRTRREIIMTSSINAEKNIDKKAAVKTGHHKGASQGHTRCGAQTEEFQEKHQMAHPTRKVGTYAVQEYDMVRAKEELDCHEDQKVEERRESGVKSERPVEGIQ